MDISPFGNETARSMVFEYLDDGWPAVDEVISDAERRSFTDDLDLFSCRRLIAVGEIIAACIDRERQGTSKRLFFALNYAYPAFQENQELRERCIEALLVVLSEKSELNKYWSDNEKLEEWKLEVRDLIDRLRDGGSE